MIHIGSLSAGWALILFVLVLDHCAICTPAVSLLGRGRIAAEEPWETEEPLDEMIVIPPECQARVTLAQIGSTRGAQPFGPAPAMAPALPPPVVVVASPAPAPFGPTIPVVMAAPAPPAAATTSTDCKAMFKKEAKQKKKEKKKAEKKKNKACKTACKAAKKLRDKAEKEAEAAAKKGGAAIEEQVKRVKEAAKKATAKEKEAVVAAIKTAGESAREELGKDMKASLEAQNATARAALEGLGDQMLAEDRGMFEQAKAHETHLAEQVQELVWKEGLHSSFDATMQMTAEAAERAHNSSITKVLPEWDKSEHDAQHALKVSQDSLHTILTMWQAAQMKSNTEWGKVTAAFDSGNIAAKLSHDTVAQTLSALELSRLLRDTATFYKMDAQESYDRAAALLTKAKEDLKTTETNAGKIAALESKTDDAAGAAARAVDAAKKVSQEIAERSKK